jgi:hypothetical protein
LTVRNDLAYVAAASVTKKKSFIAIKPAKT